MRFVFVLLLGFLALPTYAANVYRWVDEAGKVQYSDKPPVGQSKALMELDRAGRIRKGNEPILTPSERAALEAKEKAEQERRRMDKALLQSFSNVNEIDLLRDRQIEAVGAGIKTNQLRRAVVMQRAEQQQQQVDRLLKNKRPIPTDLQADIYISNKEIEDIDKAISVQQSHVESLKERADLYKRRFLELKSMQPR